MDKKEAIELLKQALTEIPNLKELDYDNEYFQLWFDKVKQVISSALGKDDLNTFISTDLPIPVIDSLTPPTVRQNHYIKRLGAYEVNIKKIIQKYELLGFDTKPSTMPETPPKAFISHGKESTALRKLKEFLETLSIEPIIIKKRASLDKDLPDKVNSYLSQADFVIILATADDTVKDKITGKEIIQPRQNVIHEIGLAQKSHPGRIIYLLEEGAEFPSNIRPRVWESFKQRNMMDAFLGIVRELRAYGMLKTVKV